MAGEASAIYEQFAHTPLKIRPARTSSSAATHLDSSSAADGTIATADKLQHDATHEKDRDVAQKTLLFSAAAAAAASPSPSGPTPPLSPTRKEQRKLQLTAPELARSKSETIDNTSSAAAPVKGHSNDSHSSEDAARKRKTSDASHKETDRAAWSRKARSAPRTVTSVAPSADSGTSVVAEPKPSKPKVKHQSQTSAQKKSSTGTETLDTPANAAQSAKRRRKSETTPRTSKAPKTTKSTKQKQTGENRSLLASFAHCVGETEDDDDNELLTPQKLEIPVTKRRARAPATPPTRRSRRIQLSLPDAAVPPDFVTDACDALLETETISGALFCVALNSLRHLQDKLLNDAGPDGYAALSNPFETVTRICVGIAMCEQLAEAQNRLRAKPLSLLTRRRGSQTVATATSKAKAAVKKSVRFQSFDLSCLNLHYVSDAGAEETVDRILSTYDALMHDVATLQQRIQSPDQEELSDDASLEASVVHGLVSALNDRAMLYVNPDTLPDEAERVYLAAFGARDPHTQSELQASRAYYAAEFAKLVPSDASASPPRAFLESMVSSLVSSTIRFKLRALFLEYDADANGASETPMAQYTHQDFGSAIHCALQESLLFAPLVAPLLALVAEPEALQKRLTLMETDDLAHIEQFALARRFLRHHVMRAYDAPSPDGFATKTWSQIEQICGIAKTYVPADSVVSLEP